MIENSTLRTLTIIVVLLAFGSGIGIYTARQKQQQIPPQIMGMLWPQPKILQPFITLDQNNREFGLQDLKDKWSFLFFGYTHCPDVCPITLTVLNQVYQDLQKSDPEPDVQMIFVSVDPERDSSQKLADYVSYFNQKFIGLGGDLNQVRSLTGQMGIAFFHEEAGENGEYLVDHTASVFLADPEGRIVAIMSAPHKPDEILSRFLRIKSFIGKQLQG